MSSVALAAAAYSPQWIISRRDDLVWFLGSALAGYFTLAVILISPTAAAPIFLGWFYLVNGPHFYATATRTYLDRDQRRAIPRWLWMIVPMTLIPLVAFAAGAKTILFIFGTTWGTFHIAKQHMGIMMLYKRKTGERDRFDFKLDKWFLVGSQMLPFALFLLWYLTVPVRGLVLFCALIVQLVVAAGYLYRQVVKFRCGAEMNWPKLMLMGLIVPLGWVALFVAFSSPISGMLVFTIGTNFGHALQYQRLTYFHNHNRYHTRSGLLGFISRRPMYFYGTAFGLCTLVLIFVRSLPATGTDILLLGPTFTHYLLDTKIWRTRNDPELARALNVA